MKQKNESNPLVYYQLKQNATTNFSLHFGLIDKIIYALLSSQ